MTRKLRIEFEGAIYHVMCRGNQSNEIFLDDKDRECFLHTLEEACERTGWKIYAYVLMGNHYHLLLTTPEANLSVGMKWFQGTYTQRFNAKNKLWGHLFQGRYKALLVDPGTDYVATVINYIHLNPARAKLFDLEKGKLTNYRWSSYPLFFRPSKRPAWLDAENALPFLGLADDKADRERYREKMQKRVFEIAHSDNPWEIDERWKKIRRGWFWGSDAFRYDLLERVSKTIEGKSRSSIEPAAMRMHDEHTAKKLLEQGLKALGIYKKSLKSMNKGALEKKVLAWHIRGKTMVSNIWLARVLHMGHPSNISSYIASVKNGHDKECRRIKKKLSLSHGDTEK